MNCPFSPLREFPSTVPFQQGDYLVVFGELFQRGYANGIVEAAEKSGLNIIYSTVGRRDTDEGLRPLTDQEIKDKGHFPLINIPLEAGFDLEPASSSGKSPVDQLHGIKLSDWNRVNMNFHELEQSRSEGIKHFRERVKKYLIELEKIIPPQANILFVHTMAGGVPRAKIVMPAMNRVFKGSGDRYASSKEFWSSDLGQFCAASFEEVTAQTLKHLLELSTPLRERAHRHNKKISYVAYGYHGTEILVNHQYQWQSYSPYLQGFAKMKLEDIACEYFDQGVSVCVYNAPEILTHSSSIFLGVEVSLYPLAGALQKEGGDKAKIQSLLNHCQNKLKNPQDLLGEVMNFTTKYMQSETTQLWSSFEQWPQHNGLEQMNQMRNASSYLIDLHKDPKDLITSDLSEVVFRACGQIMLSDGYTPQKPVWWLGHDIVAKQYAQLT